MRRVGSVCCFAALVAGSAAHAADLGVAATAAAATGWTGFYAGVGARSTAVSWDTVGFDTPGFGFAPFAADNFASLGSTDVRLSGHGGFNYQIGRWVLGIEGDVGSATNRTSAIGFPGTGVGFTALAATRSSSTR